MLGIPTYKLNNNYKQIISMFLECSKNDKAIFVNNLVRIFKTEYNREQYAALMNGIVINVILNKLYEFIYYILYI